MQKAIDEERKKIEETRQKETDLKALSAQLREKRLQSLERNDAVGVMAYQVWTAELGRIDAQLLGTALVTHAPMPELRESAITISEIPGVPLRLLLFVVLLGAIVASTVLAFFIDYVQAAVSARRAGHVSAGSASPGLRG